jgi:hypothetical protein
VYGSILQVLQTRDWHSEMFYACADKVCCAFTHSRAVHSVPHVVRENHGPNRIKVRFVQEADINTVLTEELFQLQLPATLTDNLPIGKAFPLTLL